MISIRFNGWKHTSAMRQGFYNQWASWSSLLDELKNFAANIFLNLVC